MRFNGKIPVTDIFADLQELEIDIVKHKVDEQLIYLITNVLIPTAKLEATRLYNNRTHTVAKWELSDVRNIVYQVFADHVEEVEGLTP